MKKRTTIRMLCLVITVFLLLPMALPAKAASEKYTFGVLNDNQSRTLVGVAVKNGADVLIYTASMDSIKTGTKGTFSIDGKKETNVALSSTELGGAIQCWKATEKTSIADSLYEVAKPVAKMDSGALYLSFNDSKELIKRQTPVTISEIVGDLALSIHLKGAPSKTLSDKAFGMGLLLDANGKAVGILCGTDSAICPWYSNAKKASSSGTISQKDQKLVSEGVRSIIDQKSVENVSLTEVSLYYAAFAEAFASDSAVDRCAATHKIFYRDSGLRSLDNGEKIADGYGKSLDGSFSKGAGAGIDDDSYWYFSLTFPSGIDTDVISLNAMALISGAEFSSEGSEKDETGAVNKASDILKLLLADGTSTAVTCGKLTYFFVNSNSQYIIGVDSANYFKNCNTSIKNFKTMK